MALNKEQQALAIQASYGDDILSQREAAVSLYDELDSPEALPQEPVSAELPSWDEVNARALPTWDQVQAHEEAIKPELDIDVMDSLPDSLKVGLWSIPIDKRTGAFFVSAGHGMAWIYRGVKQLAGIDEESMKADEKVMNQLYADPDAGGYAKGGNIYGSIFEPVGLALPFMRGKSVAGTVAKVGAVGAAYGSAGYVDEDSSRLGNTLLGGTIGAAFGWAVKGIEKGIERYGVREANKQLNQFEKLWAERLVAGYEKAQGAQRARTKANVVSSPMQGGIEEIIHRAAKEASQEMGKGFSLKKTAELAGRRIRPPMNEKEAIDTVKYYKSLVKQNDAAVGVDSVAGIISTRLKNINPGIAHFIRKYDEAVLGNQHRNFLEVDPFIKKYNSVIPKQEKVAIDTALSNGNMFMVEKKLEQYGGNVLVQQFQKVRAVLDDLGSQAIKHGVIKEKLDNYFPRFVTDVKGLMGSISRAERDMIQEALDKASNTKSLSALDESAIVNSVLFGRKAHEKVPLNSFAKERRFKTIPPHLMKYYASPEESLHTYIRNIVTDIEKYKFFGKNVQTREIGRLDAIDIDTSVGNYVNSVHKISPLTYTEQKELKTLLQTRFGVGERSPSSFVQNTKNILYTMLLGNPVTALTQLTDIGVSIYKNGILNTLKILPEAVLGKGNIKVKDYGLLDSLAEEFATTKKTARWLHRAFTYSGFKYMDRLGKDTLIKSTFENYSSMARNPKKLEQVIKEFTPSIGRGEAVKLADDLANRRVTDSVKTMLFSKLADVQPISLSEVPEVYLRHPNGRIAYMLKTFMLKQVDILRQDSYNEIRKGNIGKGLKNAMSYAMIMGAAGTATQVVKNQLLYGAKEETPPDITPSDIGANLLKTFGWSEYVMNSVREGKPYKAAMDAFAPPFEIVDNIISSDDGEWVKYMPIAGKLLYTWEMGGLEKMIEKDKERENKSLMKDLGLDNLGMEE